MSSLNLKGEEAYFIFEIRNVMLLTPHVRTSVRDERTRLYRYPPGHKLIVWRIYRLKRDLKTNISLSLATMTERPQNKTGQYVPTLEEQAAIHLGRRIPHTRKCLRFNVRIDL